MKISLPQYRLLRAISDLTESGLAPPSSRELAAACRVSNNAFQEQKRRLFAKGWLVFRPELSRCIKLTPEGKRVMELFELTVSGRIREDWSDRRKPKAASETIRLYLELRGLPADPELEGK